MIKQCNPGDHTRLFDIFKSNVPTYFGAHELADYKSFMETMPINYFVIEHKKKVMGGGGFTLKKDGQVASLVWDLIDASVHGQGLGSTLVKYRIERLLSMPDVKIIDIRTSNKAYKFYERFGFKTINFESDYWAKGLHLYEMEYS